MSSVHRVLITGATGFVGRHLLASIKSRQPHWKIFGWSHGRSARDTEGVDWSVVDIEDSEAVASAVHRAEPTHVVHLAAASNVAGSFADPRKTWSVNVMGTLNLLEALQETKAPARLLLVSSSEVYGDSFKQGEAVTEDTPLRPQNPYAASKAAAELLANTYVRRDLHLATVRPFNHIGVGQSEHFAIASFARQLARIEAGLQRPEISVGNLDAMRDFLDVRDVAEAYVSMLAQFDDLPPGLILNLCSGTSRKIRDVLDQLIELSSVRPRVTLDPTRMRPSDIPCAAGRADAARHYLGWTPSIVWADTLRTILQDWRDRVARRSES